MTGIAVRKGRPSKVTAGTSVTDASKTRGGAKIKDPSKAKGASKAKSALKPSHKFPTNGDADPTLEQSKPRTRRAPVNRLNDLTAKEWIPETVSVWIQRGLGKAHPHAEIERQHPAPFSFQDVARLVRFFSKAGETVLDPFAGVGSTLKACRTT